MHINNKINISVTAMCRVAAKKLLNKSLQICREHAGSLLQAARLSGSAQVNVKFSVIVMYVRLLTLISSLLVELGF